MLNAYITNLGKYNEGELVGEWISLPITEDELEEVLERIGINEEYEEYFFIDSDADFSHNLGEYENIDDLNELGEALEGADADLIAAIMEAYTSDINDALDMVDDVIFYPGYSLIDVAYEIVEECYELPEIAQRYFDYEAFARDLSFDGYTETAQGVICQ